MRLVECLTKDHINPKVQASASQPPDPHLKTPLVFIPQVECCLCIPCVVQNTKQHLRKVLIHAGSV